jgi:L-serine dehydratase
MNNSPITTSIFDLFKVGPGPSSSHTIGPMKAAFDFLERLQQLPEPTIQTADSIQVYLYGSLSATGKGHGTDRAIVAGLLGWQPESTDPVALLALLKDQQVTYPVRVGNREFNLGAQYIHFERKKYDSPYANTVVFKLIGLDAVLFEQEYYSIGGGFILRKGEVVVDQSTINLPYPYQTMKELKAQLKTHQLTLEQLMLANETALTGRSPKEINQRIDLIVDFMHKAVRRGLRHTGTLPGSIKLRRKRPCCFSRHAVWPSRRIVF